MAILRRGITPATREEQPMTITTEVDRYRAEAAPPPPARTFTVPVSATWRPGFWADVKLLTIAGYTAEARTDGRWIVHRTTVPTTGPESWSGQKTSWEKAMTAAEKTIKRQLVRDMKEAA